MEWTCPNCGTTGITGYSCSFCYKQSSGRFNVYWVDDDLITIYDSENNYLIDYTETDGYIAYTYEDGQEKEVYHIFPDGVTSIKIKNLDHDITCTSPMRIEDMHTEMKVMDNGGGEVSISNGNITKIVVYDNDNDIFYTHIYNQDGSSSREYFDGSINYYDKNGYEYKRVFSDGSMEFDNIPGYFNSNGTYEVFNDDKRSYEVVGTYTYDENGNVILKNNDGTVTVLSETGEKIKSIDATGKVFTYDNLKNSQEVLNNGKASYSMINHIEYDEDAYNNILTTLNSIGEANISSISSACSDIESSINSFPDQYSSNGIGSVESNIKGHIDLIGSLAEMTNYSLLAYQTCDDNLKQKLEALVDSLFGDSDKILGENFKKIINTSIEDRDNDGIYEFKEDNNFKKTYILSYLVLNNHNIDELSGYELNKFKDDLCLNDSESLLVLKEVVDINGVNMEIYRSIDVDEVDLENYEKFVAGSNDQLRNVNQEVLKYVNKFGTPIVYCSGHSVAPDLYNKNYAGISFSDSKATLTVYLDEGSIDDTDAILHELGHTLDFCIYDDLTGEYGSTTYNGFNYSMIPGNTRELAHSEYGAYSTDYEYMEGYENSDAYQPTEFFAESFRNYYTLNQEKHDRFALLIPQTFNFFDNIEEWVGEKNAT